MKDKKITLREFINELPFFDMHSHMAGFDLGTPVNDRKPRSLYGILMNDYLSYLSVACLDKQLKTSRKQDSDISFPYEEIEPILKVCRNLTTYYALREGIRLLHPFNESDISSKNWKQIDESIRTVYSKYGERKWQRMVCKKMRVLKQVHIATLPYVTLHLNSLSDEERKEQLSFLMPSLVIDGYAFTGFEVQHQAREMSYEIIGIHPETLEDYLSFCEKVIQCFKQHGGKSVKLLISYFRTLAIKNVSIERARQLFPVGYKNLSRKALHTLQDFLLRQIMKMVQAEKLPLIVHTGYSIPSSYGEPENLLHILDDPELNHLKIAISHSAWPNEGKAMILARTYRNCYFDFSWTPLLSQSLGYKILSEAIDIVPINKILIGTDCGTAECFAGTVMLIRDTLYNVLSEKLSKGILNLDTAKSIARAILWDNAIEFHSSPRELKCN